MGWSGGGRLVGSIIETLQKHVTDETQRKAIYLEIIPEFENEDWDTQEEYLGVDRAFDSALKELNPKWDWDRLN